MEGRRRTARGVVTLVTHVDFCCGLLLHNLLQQQKSTRNHTKVQLQQNAQQTWLQVTDDDVILIARVLLSAAFVNECKKKKLISANGAFGLVDG